MVANHCGWLNRLTCTGTSCSTFFFGFGFSPESSESENICRTRHVPREPIMSPTLSAFTPPLYSFDLWSFLNPLSYTLYHHHIIFLPQRSSSSRIIIEEKKRERERSGQVIIIVSKRTWRVLGGHDLMQIFSLSEGSGENPNPKKKVEHSCSNAI